MEELFTWAKAVGLPTIMLIVAVFFIAKFALNSVLVTVRAEQDAGRKVVKTAVEESQKNFTDAMATARREYIASLNLSRQEFLEAIEKRNDVTKKIAEEHARTEARCMANSEAIQRELLGVIAVLKGVRRTSDVPTRSRPIKLSPPETPPES